MWEYKFELPDGSQSVSDIYKCFEYIIKKHVTDNPPLRIYVNKIEIENRITTPEMMKLLGSIKNKITKDENGENVPHLEITEVVLVHCNIVKSDFFS